jgi:hypothetical protein
MMMASMLIVAMMLLSLMLLQLNSHDMALSSVSSDRPVICTPSPMYSEDDRCVHASQSGASSTSSPFSL